MKVTVEYAHTRCVGFIQLCTVIMLEQANAGSDYIHVQYPQQKDIFHLHVLCWPVLLVNFVKFWQ